MEEALDLSFDRLLMMMMMIMVYITVLTSLFKVVYVHSSVLRLSANRVTIFRRKFSLNMDTCYTYCIYIRLMHALCIM